MKCHKEERKGGEGERERERERERKKNKKRKRESMREMDSTCTYKGKGEERRGNSKKKGRRMGPTSLSCFLLKSVNQTWLIFILLHSISASFLSSSSSIFILSLFFPFIFFFSKA